MLLSSGPGHPDRGISGLTLWNDRWGVGKTSSGVTPMTGFYTSTPCAGDCLADAIMHPGVVAGKLASDEFIKAIPCSVSD
jgi:hypothetical protein